MLTSAKAPYFLRTLVLFSFLLVLFYLFPINGDVKLSSKCIQAHFIVKDFHSARQEAQAALKDYPQHKEIHELYIRALAHLGEEKALWIAWNDYERKFPDSALSNHELQEMMAWGVIIKGADSPSPLVRLCALLGAFYSQDSKGILLLKKFCRDKNALIRSAAVQLSGHLHDAILSNDLLALSFLESNWQVKLEIIKAIGSMKLRQGGSFLLKVINDEKATSEEKSAAIQSLIALTDKIERVEIEKLAKSNWAGLRLLACQVVSYLHLTKENDLMELLVNDNHYEVRMAALYTLGILSDESPSPFLYSLAQAKIHDPVPEVAILAAWLLTKIDPHSSKKAFTPFFSHPKQEIRYMAAAALAATGQAGVRSVQEFFYESKDPFIRMNLALGLICQQKDITAACQVLHEQLNSSKEKWMWKEVGSFKVLSPYHIKKENSSINTPTAVDQLTRLEILNSLAVLKYPHAEQAIKRFLEQNKWGISGLAAAVLLMEGDETSLNHVQGLLNDEDSKIRIQAALTLSIWGRREESIAVLENAYLTADRETKERILEGLGRIGSRGSIPFLVQRLQESHQTLRLIAASSLLQCLYH